MARLGQLGLERRDLNDLFDNAVGLLAEALDLPWVALFEFMEARGVLVGRAGVYDKRSVGSEAASALVLPAGRGSFPGYTLLEGSPVAADDLLNDPRFIALAPTLGFGARAAISVPVRWNDHDWGVLGVYSESVRTWSDDEVNFVRSAANVIGLAVQRARIDDRLTVAETRLDLSLRAGDHGRWTWLGSEARIEMDEVALAMHGLRPGEFSGTPDDYRELVEPEDRDLIIAAVAGVLDGVDAWDETYRVPRSDTGAVCWIRSRGTVIRTEGEPLRIVGVCADVTERVLEEARLDASLLAEMAARRRAEQAGARLATLSEASTVFSQSLEPDTILAAVAEFCVPLLADVCRVETLDEAGNLLTRTVRAVADDRLRAFEDLEADCPGFAAVLSLSGPVDPGAPIVVDDITAEAAAAAVTEPAQRDALARLGPRSVVIAPLVARSTVLGRLTLVETDHLRRQRADHVAMVEEVAARAALALDNGRLYQSRARMVDSLQSVLIPRDLPDSEGLSFAARYRVGDPRTDVGGDFYDAFEIGDHEWGVMVGDVCGRGTDAAALTGLVRHSIRAAVVRDSRPTQVLAQTNDAVMGQIDDFRFCTATYMNVKRTASGARVVVSSAGHPRPVLVRSDGRTEMLECSGVLLGVVRDPNLAEVQLDLDPGDALVLYTDGVTEARGVDGLFGDERLVGVLAANAGRTADEIASALETAVRAHHPDGEDDLAIVVVQALAP